MEKKFCFCLRLLSGKRQQGPAFGADSEGEARLLIVPEGTAPERLNSFNASLLLELKKDGALLLRDDGKNVLHHYYGMHGTEKDGNDSSFAVFSLGAFLCGLASGDDLMVPEHARCLSLAGVEVLVAMLRSGERSKAPFHAVARTRAAENGIYVILADGFSSPSVFGPEGEGLFPSFPGNETGEICLRKGDAGRKTLSRKVLRRKDLYHSLTAL